MRKEWYLTAPKARRPSEGRMSCQRRLMTEFRHPVRDICSERACIQRDSLHYARRRHNEFAASMAPGTYLFRGRKPSLRTYAACQRVTYLWPRAWMGRWCLSLTSRPELKNLAASFPAGTVATFRLFTRTLKPMGSKSWMAQTVVALALAT